MIKRMNSREFTLMILIPLLLSISNVAELHEIIRNGSLYSISILAAFDELPLNSMVYKWCT